MNLLRILPLLVLAFLLGCMSDEETDQQKQMKKDDELVQKYIQDNQIEAERDGTGFYYAPLVSNPSGEPVATQDIITFKYKISLLNGQLVEESTDSVHKAMHNVFPGIRSEFNRALNPAGIDLGLAYMREGEKFLFVIPSYLAYYNYSNGNTLPPYSNLVAEVEVTDIISEEDQKLIEKDSIEAYIRRNELENVESFSSGLHFITREEGTGDKPSSGHTVKVAYTGRLLDGTVFDKSEADEPISFVIGKGQVIKGWDEGIALMKEGGKATLIIPSHLAYYQSALVIPESINKIKIPPFSTLVFDVELVDIQ